jgi:hypothetical protein
MAQGNYDHPTYITRQMDSAGLTTVGNGGTSLTQGFPMDIMFRGFSAAVVTAGTTAGMTLTAYSLVGTVTTSLAAVTLTTSVANTVVTSPDPNALIPAGGLLFYKNGTDATGKANITQTFHGSPSSGTWGAP